MQVGTRVVINRPRWRRDGLLERTVFVARIVRFDAWVAEYAVEKMVHSENVLREPTEGGFSLAYTRDELASFGIHIID